jgi:uncharacterized membrane protein YdjX (TVP38/TMEM64 family)
MAKPSWEATVVAVAFVALVGLALDLATTANGGKDFTTIWTGVGTIVGIMTGAIPSYFFANAQANKAAAATKRATDHAVRAAAFEAALTPEARAALPTGLPRNPDL